MIQIQNCMLYLLWLSFTVNLFNNLKHVSIANTENKQNNNFSKEL